MGWKAAGLGLVISAASLSLAVRQVRPAETAASLLGARPAFLLLSIALLLVAVAVRSWRWQVLLRLTERVSFGGAVSATLIGYLVNSVLPGRVGELVRAYLISQSDGVSTGRAVGTIFVEKLLDIVVLLLLLGVVAWRVPLPEWAAQGATAAAAASGAAALAFLTLARSRDAVAAWLRARLDPVPGMRRLDLPGFSERALGAADGLAKPLPLLSQLTLSIAVWAVSAGAVYAVMHALSLPLPATAAVLVLALTNLGMAVPSAPAYVGVYHLLATETLQLYGIDRSAALSYALAMHAMTYGVFVIGGLAFMWRHRYGLADLRWRRRRAPLPLEGAAHHRRPAG
ncbi:MAG: lysylphosphatidylglycerol synthase transmembrane domain-containing protein [Chloroflexota bacterium]